MAKRRLERLNSLLKEVLSDVIRAEVKDPNLPILITITSVDITSDLSYAKVHVSVIGNAEQKKQAIKVLNRASGFIAQKANKQVVIRYFPALTFVLDDSLDHQLHIESVLQKLNTPKEEKASDE
jgi:ribosome-binding factor A